jgi:rfaE bifunctional protein nucleotidyltransferase chain/domain
MNDNPMIKLPQPDDVSARHKVRTVQELAGIVETLRAQGKVVVLCHGVFDLVHMGHIRHLEAARKEGDILVVTLTADRYVNKGPGRPIFPDHMRAEMMAAIGYVDYVAVNESPTAESVLRALKPSVYVKGSDYENPEEDVTGGIRQEREALEDHGGRIVFTKDITFSSSALINRYLDVYDPPLRDFLSDFRERVQLDGLLSLIDSIKDKRVLMVGETIIDEYQYVEGLGKPSKENIVATQSKGRELFAGGVIAAANHLADFCAEVEVVTTLGKADSFEKLIRENLRPNVKLSVVYVDEVPTTRKTRFVEVSYMRKLFEVYTFDDTPLAGKPEARLNNMLAEKAAGFDLVVVTDFGHGMISPSAIATLAGKARFLAVNSQTNAGNQGFNLITKYPRADYICIDGGEARLAVSEKYRDLAVIAGELLPKSIACSKLIVTGGVNGCYTYDAGAGTHRIPAFTKTVIDTVGAGDAFFAITSPLVAAGGDMEQVGFIGNAVGAMKVGIVGHRTSVEKVPLIKFLTTLMK